MQEVNRENINHLIWEKGEMNNKKDPTQEYRNVYRIKPWGKKDDRT